MLKNLIVYLAIGIVFLFHACSSIGSEDEELENGYDLTFESSPYDFIKRKSGNSKNPLFLNLIDSANLMYNESGKDYWECLHVVTDTSGIKLSLIFHQNDEKYSLGLTNEKVINKLKDDFSFDMERSRIVIQHRLESMGVKVTAYSKQGPNRMKMTMYNVPDVGRLNRVVSSGGEIGFFRTFSSLESYSFLMRLVRKLNERDSLYALNNEGTYDSTLFLNKLTNLVQLNFVRDANGGVGFMDGSAFLMARVEDTAEINSILQDTILGNLILPLLHFKWQMHPTYQEGVGDITYLHLLKAEIGNKPVLTGDLIVGAISKCSPSSNGCQIELTFNTQGAEKFSNLTRSSIGNSIAVVFNGKIISAPVVQSPIDDGLAVINGNFQMDEAKDLAAMFRSGSIPLNFKIVESKKIK